MKRTIIIMMVAVAMFALLASAVCAQDTGDGFSKTITKFIASGTVSGFESVALDSGLTYNFWYEGAATLGLTAKAGTANLTGNSTTEAPTTNIWRYYYQKMDDTWVMFDSIVAPLSCTSTNAQYSAASDDVRISSNPLTLTNIQAIGIGYNITLSKTGLGIGVGSGTGTLTAIAVPEPGSLIALCGGLFGLAGFAVRRRI